jgi:hypothetical protein
MLDGYRSLLYRKFKSINSDVNRTVILHLHWTLTNIRRNEESKIARELKTFHVVQ